MTDYPSFVSPPAGKLSTSYFSFSMVSQSMDHRSGRFGMLMQSRTFFSSRTNMGLHQSRTCSAISCFQTCHCPFLKARKRMWSQISMHCAYTLSLAVSDALPSPKRHMRFPSLSSRHSRARSSLESGTTAAGELGDVPPVPPLPKANGSGGGRANGSGREKRKSSFFGRIKGAFSPSKNGAAAK